MSKQSYNRYTQIRNKPNPSQHRRRMKIAMPAPAQATEPRIPLRIRVETLLKEIDRRLVKVRRSWLALTAIPAFIVGAIFGLVILGWWIFPVEWTNAGMNSLNPASQAAYVEIAADLYSIDHNTERAARVMSWDDGTAVCRVLNAEQDEASRLRLAYLAMIVNGAPCDE